MGAEDFSYYGEKAPSFFFFPVACPKGNDPAKALPTTPQIFLLMKVVSMFV
jgi:metal-dependent amidase/aminoacylase/carboxypeptidase family protein